MYVCSQTVAYSLSSVAEFFCGKLAVSFLFIVRYFSSVCFCHCSLNIFKDTQFHEWKETPVFVAWVIVFSIR
jgi:hypothetical protein